MEPGELRAWRRFWMGRPYSWFSAWAYPHWDNYQSPTMALVESSQLPGHLVCVMDIEFDTESSTKDKVSTANGKPVIIPNELILWREAVVRIRMWNLTDSPVVILTLMTGDGRRCPFEPQSCGHNAHTRNWSNLQRTHKSLQSERNLISWHF